MPEQKASARINVRPYDFACHGHVSARQVGFITKKAAFVSPNPRDPINIRDGLRHRVMLQPPKSSRWFYARLRLFVRRWLADNIRVVGEPLSFDDWLCALKVPQERKKQLRLAYDDGPQRAKWSKCKSFGKREFYPLLKVLRLINSRVDNYKVFAGPWFQWVESVVKAQVPSFVKGLNPSERNERVMSRMTQPLIYVSDFSRFESQMTRSVMRACEIELYKYFGLPEDILQPLIGINSLNFGDLSASVEATRMSGDMCTSLGNGFTNLMLNSLAASDNNSELSGCVEGDDGIYSVSVLPTEEQFRRYGFKMSIKQVAASGEAGFCSSYWTVNNDPIVDPIRHLLRVGWSFHCPAHASNSYRAFLFRSKCRSLLDLAPGCPLLWKIASWHSTEGLMRNERDSWKYGELAGLIVADSAHELIEPSMEARLLVDKLFNISLVDQERCEREIEQGNLDCLLPFVSDDQISGSYFLGPENVIF